MNFNAYLQTVLLRARPMACSRQLEHAQIGMLTELGELGDLIKKEFVKGIEFDRVNLMEECGDYLWYFVLYAHEAGISMVFLDGVLAKCMEAPKKPVEPDSVLLRMLGQATGMLSAPADLTGLGVVEQRDLVEVALMIIVVFLLKYDFTMEQCLVANDAKLELRHGQKFSAETSVKRDTAAERTILEDHAGRTN